MALTTNQVSDVVQGAVGRPATDFEVSQFSKSPIQDLAGLKGYYGGLNKDTSIVDYLKYSGQDSSIENRKNLATKYGLTNYDPTIGQSNIDLMTALKGGKTPETAPTVQGSVSGATTPSGGSQDTTGAPTDQPQPQPTTPTQDTSTPPRIPGVDDALAAYKNSQQQVVDIDKAISSSLDNKRKEIIASGGVVDESQLKSIVYAENAPLLEQRKTLVAEQANAGKNYQSMLAAQKESDANFYKTYAAKQKDVAQTEKSTIDAAKLEQAQQKIDISNVKVVKTTAYDEYGNKTGDVIRKVTILPDGSQKTVDMPLASNGALTPTGVKIASSGPVGDPNTSSAAVITSTSSPAYVKSFTGNADAPTAENQNIKVPGTTLTVGSLYQGALDWMAKPQTSSSGRGTKTVIINSNSAIAAKGAAMLQSLGITKTTYEAAYKANSAALAKQMGSFAQLSVNEKAANINFKTLLRLSATADATIYQSSSPLLEGWIKGGAIAVSGNQDVNNFAGQLVLTMTEYAKVITGQTSGAAVSDTARAETQKLLSTGFNTAAIQNFYDNVATPDINGRVTAARSSINDLVGGLQTGTPGTGPEAVSRGNLDAKTFVEKALTSAGLKYDTLVGEMKGQAPDSTHTVPALDNTTGAPVFASQTEIDSGEYTPL